MQTPSTRESTRTTTRKPNNTVVIIYDPDQQLFLSSREHHPFTAEKLLGMLNWRVSCKSVSPSCLGDLTIRVGAACCSLTKQAVDQLFLLYQQEKEHQQTFPLCHLLFCQRAAMLLA